jgi:hydroxymethylbilane synthase
MRLCTFRPPYQYLLLVFVVVACRRTTVSLDATTTTTTTLQPGQAAPVVAAMTMIRIGSRPSKLATIQAEAVAEHLKRCHPFLQPIIVPIDATGDIVHSASGGVGAVVQDAPLALTRNVDFTSALDQALLEEAIDVAVHSLKDIPPDHRWTNSKGRLAIHCPLTRENSSDVLIGPYRTLHELPDGCKVGTSSIRRQAQLRAKCPNAVQVVNLRGNVEARIEALRQGTVDALILAQSGLHRLQLDNNNSSNNDDKQNGKFFMTSIPSQDMLPGVCQGIVAAVVVKGGDHDSDEFWRSTYEATLMASAERAFLNCLDESSLASGQGRPPLAGLLTVTTTSTATTTPLLSSSASSSSTSWGDDDVVETEGHLVFQGLLARADGTKVLSAQQSTVIQGRLPNTINEDMTVAKAVADALGQGVGLALLQQAGPHFLD